MKWRPDWATCVCEVCGEEGTCSIEYTWSGGMVHVNPWVCEENLARKSALKKAEDKKKQEASP